MKNIIGLIVIILSLLILDLYWRSVRDSNQSSLMGVPHLIDSSRFYIEYDTIPMDRGSTYYPSYEQCARRDSVGNIDSTSNIFNTSDGSFIDMGMLDDKKIRWIALPSTMIRELGGNTVNFGDTVLFYSPTKTQINGKWVVHDVVSGRWGNTVDFLISPQNNKPKLGIATDIVMLLNPRPKHRKK